MDIESIQKICKQLPQVTEDIKWEQDLVYDLVKAKLTPKIKKQLGFL